MDSKKITSGVLYAIGEIFLVVIGILIAVSIDNWNQDSIEEAQQKKYYKQIDQELSDFISQLEKFIVKIQAIETQNRRSLTLLSSGHPDSLKQLPTTLGALGTSWAVTWSLPILDEFLANGYLTKVKNDSLKSSLRQFGETIEKSRSENDYIHFQYQNVIEPYFNKNLNYAEVAMDRYKEKLVAGGPSVDYTLLKNDRELWNILTFKLEATSIYLGNIKELLPKLKTLQLLIQNEYKK